MKVLETQDYQRIFFKGISFDTDEKVAGYFTGKFNEVKECNPKILFIDGIEKAFNAFEQQFKKQYYEDKKEYYQLIQLNPALKDELEQPDLNVHRFPCIYIDSNMIGHYSIFFFGFKFIAAFIVSLIGLIINAFCKAKITFGEIYKLSIYALTFSIILKAFFIVIGIQVPQFWILYYGIPLIYLGLGLNLISKDQNQDLEKDIY